MKWFISRSYSKVIYLVLNEKKTEVIKRANRIKIQTVDEKGDMNENK